MYSLLMCLCFAGQVNDSSPSVRKEVVQIAFELSQEEFARQVDLSGKRSAQEYVSKLLEHLGSPSWKVREAANERLYGYFLNEPGERRWLFWELHSKDAEINWRCYRMLRLVTICPICKGKGRYAFNPDSSPDYTFPCNDCNEIGNYWNMYLFHIRDANGN